MFPAASVLIEIRHLRQDRSHRGDVYAIGNGMHMKDYVMDIIITYAIKHSCLTHAIKGCDYVIRDAESVKFKKDARSSGPVQSSSTRRLIPLALNHLGRSDGHF